MKKFIAAVIIAVIVMLVIGCVNSSAQGATTGCVTKKEYKNLMWNGGRVIRDTSPNGVSKMFHARGDVRSSKIRYRDFGEFGLYEVVVTKIRYKKCGGWGSDSRFVRVWYRVSWEPAKKTYDSSDIMSISRFYKARS